MMIHEINIDPMPKPRMVRSDKWAKRPVVEKYYAWCNEIRLKFKEKIPGNVYLLFHVPMPNSWSQKKKNKMHMTPHQQRPDLDNYIKAFLDATCEDDSYIYHIVASKSWAKEGKICVGIDEIIT